MDANTITTIVASLGFPICACIACGWYVKYITDQHRADSIERNKTHAEEMNSITQALNNNTLMLQKLCDRLDNMKGGK